MKFSRRDTLTLALGGLAVGLLSLRAAQAAQAAQAATVAEMAAAFAGGATPKEGGITLTAPEIAENGNTVPVEVDAPGAVAIMLLAAGNPVPAVATFTFGPAAATQRAATRIRLATTQDVIALAKMADGSVVQASTNVKVTIGGCGG